MNPIRRLLFGTGRLPEVERARLTAEGILLLAEGLPGSITYRHYRAPGERASWERIWMSMAIGITRRRLVIWTRPGKHMDVPHDHPTRRSVTVTLEGTDRACVGYDAEAFSTVRSGRVELRMRTRQAAEIVAMLSR